MNLALISIDVAPVCDAIADSIEMSFWAKLERNVPKNYNSLTNQLKLTFMSKI